MKKITIELDEVLHTKVKLRAVTQGETITTIVTRALETYVGAYEAKMLEPKQATTYLDTMPEPVKTDEALTERGEPGSAAPEPGLGPATSDEPRPRSVSAPVQADAQPRDIPSRTVPRPDFRPDPKPVSKKKGR